MKLVQELYLNKLVKNAKNGFMLCNFVSNMFKVRSYSLQELVNKLNSFGKKVKIKNEDPLTFNGNKLIYWS